MALAQLCGTDNPPTLTDEARLRGREAAGMAATQGGQAGELRCREPGTTGTGRGTGPNVNC